MNTLDCENMIPLKEVNKLKSLIGLRILNILFLNSYNIDVSANPKFEVNSFFSNSLTRFVFWNYPKDAYFLFDLEVDYLAESIFGCIHLFKIKRLEEIQFTPLPDSYRKLFYDGLEVENSFSLQIGSPIVEKIEIYGARSEGVRKETSLSNHPIQYKVNIDSLILFYIGDRSLLVITGDARGAGVNILLVSESGVNDYLSEKVHGATNEWDDKIYTLIHTIE